jgi:hypothetical protein
MANLSIILQNHKRIQLVATHMVCVLCEHIRLQVEWRSNASHFEYRY